ncbi:site-specific integrase [Streptomyces sp. 8N114]|uniref:site-specific integrase n=1 Tax=Streptomyces sp. 8N114 TaxID=3457419 RepID=UPI003FD0BBF1
MLTYDVKFYEIEHRPDRRKPYRVRWVVGGNRHSKSYQLKPQAEGRKSELMEAARRGEQFDTERGLPVSELRAKDVVTWYEHACAYVLMKWPRAAAKHRAGIADALATATPALLKQPTSRPTPSRSDIRQALFQWAFRMVRNDKNELVPRHQVEEPPPRVSRALAWVSQNSLTVQEAANPEAVRKALNAVSAKLNGEQAAENTARRKRMVLNSTYNYALERELIEGINPLKRVDWQAPQTDDEVDFRYVPDPKLASALIREAARQGARGAHLHAYFGCLYYAAMRPAEISQLKAKDCRLPKKGWGTLTLDSSSPEVSTGWTDAGKPYDERGLKRRARKTTRPVPIPPVLVTLLRTHLDTYGTADDGRLFRAARGGRVRSTEYCEVWHKARRKVLSPADAKTPLAEVPYSLRHAGVSLWITAGVEPTEVARRAGHSLAVLYRVYAKILTGRQDHSNELIDKALGGLPAPSDKDEQPSDQDE